MRGVLVASDHTIEWLLPWWWKNYSRYNTFPVAFVDLGISSQMVRWCKKKGQLIDLFDLPEFAQQKEQLSSKVIQDWEAIYKGDVWQARKAWFKKPLACLKSPFELTLWMDIDCEVCGPLNPLFAEWGEGIEVALVRDERHVEERNFSSGVMLFAKGVPFLERWAELCRKESGQHMGDQNVLTQLLYSGEVAFKELDPIYNWIMYQGYNPAAVIAHWGAWGKEYLQRFGGIHELLGNKKGFAARDSRGIEGAKPRED